MLAFNWAPYFGFSIAVKSLPCAGSRTIDNYLFANVAIRLEAAVSTTMEQDLKSKNFNTSHPAFDSLNANQAMSDNLKSPLHEPLTFFTCTSNLTKIPGSRT
jgi:hypothetical protein